MKRKLVPLFTLLICAGIAIAQPTAVPLGVRANDPIAQKLKADWSDKVSITDLNGQPIGNRYPDVNGTPFFNEEYKYSNIILKNGRTFKSIKARIDLVTQEVHFVSSNGIPAFMEKGTVKEISYADTTESGIVPYKFQTGFVSVIDKSSDNFYLVLAEGNYCFLKSITKKVTEKRNELTHESYKEFETYEDYFCYTKGEMKRWKKDKDLLLSELADKKPQIDQFMQSNKINFKNAESVAKLLSYYNSL
jgi:hypothetical protein